MDFRLWMEMAAHAHVSPTEARDKKLFGPVYHGTSEENRNNITEKGFEVFVGLPRSASISHGYQQTDYAGGTWPPIHHLGFGIYMTTSKTIAKNFNHGSMRGLKPYMLDVPRLETINFGSNKRMMGWWKDNGYNMPSMDKMAGWSKEEKDQKWLQETLNMTKTLNSKYDAVWFKGKSLYRLLDGDQICVYDPSKIFELDHELAKSGEIGSKIYRKIGGIVYRDYAHTGRITRVIPDVEGYRTHWASHSPDSQHPWLKPETKKMYDVKWNKGGHESNVQDGDVELD